MLNIGILVFDDVEVLDFCGPFEVFTTASRVHTRKFGPDAPFRCTLVAPELRTVRARAGLRALPDRDLSAETDIDVLIVPGGDVSGVLRNRAVIEWIRHQYPHTRITASVCTGADAAKDKAEANADKAAAVADAKADKASAKADAAKK